MKKEKYPPQLHLFYGAVDLHHVQGKSVAHIVIQEMVDVDDNTGEKGCERAREAFKVEIDTYADYGGSDGMRGGADGTPPYDFILADPEQSQSCRRDWAPGKRFGRRAPIYRL